MTNITKISIFIAVIAVVFGALAFTPVVSEKIDDTVLAPIAAFAYGGGGGDGGCCGDDGGDYGDGGYYGGGGDGGCCDTPDDPDPGCDGDCGGGEDPCLNNPYGPTCNPPESNPPSCDSFTGSPTTLPYGGGSVTLEWATTNATGVSINNGVGAVSGDGSTVVNVTDTITYILTATNTDGNDTCQVTITVNPPESDASCDLFTANPTSLPDGGGNVTLTWETTNATAVSINNGVGTVSADGSTVVSVTDTITYVLTATGTNGNDTCQATITVGNDSSLSCDSFTASDEKVRRNARVTLTWETTGVSSVSIDNGVGNNLPADGSIEVIVDNDNTYTLTLSNGTQTKTCKVSIDTESGGGGGGGGGSSSPKCDLEISDKKVKAGEKITLTWDTKNAKEIKIEDDHGNEIFESDKKKYLDGEVDVIVYKDTEFTLNAERGSKKRKCKVEVEVEEDEIEVFEKREQPLVIALTQVPYTGFEAGPVLTALFYSLLALWALFIAYILVIRRDSIFGYSLNTDNGAVTEAEAVEAYKKKVKMLAAQHSHQPWNPKM